MIGDAWSHVMTLYMWLIRDYSSVVPDTSRKKKVTEARMHALRENQLLAASRRRIASPSLPASCSGTLAISTNVVTDGEAVVEIDEV
jgi:hypothetical protein